MRSLARLGLLLAGCMAASTIPAAPPPTMGEIDVDSWLGAASPLNDEAVWRYGHVLMTSTFGGDQFLRDAKRRKYVLDLLAAEANLDTEGFTRGTGNFRAPAPFFSGKTSGPAEPLSLTWTQTTHRNYIGLVFIVLEDLRTPETTGREQIAVYHNDYRLGTYHLGDRTALPYTYPYSSVTAQATGTLPLECNFEDGFDRKVQYGLLLRERRNFLKGDTLRLVAEAPGSYRISGLLLVPLRDTVDILEPAIRHTAVKVWPDERLQFTWTTRLPSRCILIWNTDREALAAGHGQVVQQSAYGENHQYYADSEPDAGENVYYRILAEANDGRRVATAMLSFTRPVWPATTVRAVVPLQAIDPVTVAGAPAYASLTLPGGALRDLGHVRLRRLDTDRPVPAQFAAVSHYGNGSIRWLGAHFRAVPGVDYAVEYGPDVRTGEAAGGLAVERRGGRLTVAGGDLRAVFDPTARAGLATLETDAANQSWKLQAGDIRLTMTGPEGKVFTAGPAEDFRLEQTGPEHVAVRAAGHFLAADGEPLLHYIVRWRMYRDHPGVDLELTVGNDRDEEKYACLPPTGEPDPGPYSAAKPLNWYFAKFRDLYLDIDLPPGGELRLGVSNEWTTPAEVGRRVQKDEKTIVDADGNEREGRLDGRALWHEDGRTLGVHLDRCWQQYPKSFEQTEKSLRIGIMPAYDPAWYPTVDLDAETQTFSRYSRTARSWWYLRHGLYQFMYGKQKTHRLHLVFGQEADRRISADRVVGPPALFMPPPAYNCATPGFGDFQRIRAADGTYPAVNEWLAKRREEVVAARDYGMMNFGDTWGERRTHNWLGLQRDFAQAAAAEFWRTGSREWLSLAYEAAMHFADVDTIHYGPNAGFQVMHAVGHTGKEYFLQEGIETPGYPCVLHAGHMRIGGIRNLAAITGSGPLREATVAHGDIRGGTSTVLLTTLAHRGYNVGAMFECYELEGNPFYLNGARIHFDHMVFDIDPFTGEGYTNVPPGYLEVTGDRRVDYVLDNRIKTVPWDPVLKLKVAIPWHGVRQMRVGPEAIGGEAYVRTGDPKYARILEDHMACALSITPRSALDFVDRFGGNGLIVRGPSWTWYLDAADIGALTPRELPPDGQAHYDAALRRGLENEQ